MISALLNKADKGALLFLVSLVVLYLFVLFKNSILITGFAIVLPLFCWLIWLIWRQPELIFFAFFGSSVLFFDSQDGITLLDAIYFTISITVFVMLLFYIIQNSATAFNNSFDYLFLFFYLMLFYGVIIGLISKSSPIKVIGELSYYLPSLGYFFYRDLLTKKKNQKIFLTLLLFIFLFVEIRNFYFYREIIIQATFSWQAENARIPLNEVILLLASIFFAVFSMLYRDYRIVFICLILFGTSVAALVLTQSRGYWLAFIVSMMTLLLFSSSDERKRLFFILGILSIGAYIFGTIFFTDIIDLVIEGLINRFQSIGSGSLDISLKDRIVESQIVLEKTLQSPITGHGLGTTFRREVVSANINYFKDMSFVHNGYLMAWYKFGIFGLIFFLWLSFQILISSIKIYKQHSDSVYRLIALIIFCSFSGMLVVNLTSPQFLHFESILLITVMAAFLSNHTKDL